MSANLSRPKNHPYMNKTVIVTSLLIVFAVLVGFLGFQLYTTTQENKQQKEDLESAAELLDYEKKQTEKEFRELALEVEGYNTNNIKNDSLVFLLDEQKQKIRQLLDELRTVKSTNAKRISQLKEELSTVRTVLINYIRQVDSLNKVNQGLMVENSQYRQVNTELTETKNKLTKDKQYLTQVVERAAQLETNNITVKTLNKRGHKTRRLRKTKTIAVYFDIAKNITANPGEKVLYARIVKPNAEVLYKSVSNTFKYENQQLQYSIRKAIEYKGEAMKQEMFWDVNETLLEGLYQLDIFCDGRLVGSTSFELD